MDCPMGHPEVNVRSDPEWERMLAAIPASWTGECRQRPCRAVLNSGRVVERLLCVEEAHGLMGRDWIHPREIRLLEGSPLRLPVEFANRLYEFGETCMGGIHFAVTFRNGVEHRFLCGSAVVDFPAFPPGLRGADVVLVTPLPEDSVRKRRTLGEAPFEVCYHA
jgi:hypothetical protein